MSKKKLSLFEGYGIEIEYAIVDSKTLNIKPLSDELIYSVAHEYRNEVISGNIIWSNELMLHLIELKTNGPTKNLKHTADHFHREVKKINDILSWYDAKLMPTACHPWMIPKNDSLLWPHDDDEIYKTYDNIFDCHGHGWSNLQSVHLNLPFSNDEEFARLHAAIRLILPILPALCASSPIIEGKITGYVDTRLKYYLENRKRIASITGKLIPEAIFSPQEYKKTILEQMYKDISIYDKSGLIQFEWLNSRGAIPRFDRNSIEIRVIDSQECPIMDIAILEVIIALLKILVDEKWISFEKQKTFHEDNLYTIFYDSIKLGLAATISNEKYLSVFNFQEKFASLKTLWQHILSALNQKRYLTNKNTITLINKIITQGNLADRILAFLKHKTNKDDLHRTYETLSQHLKENRPFFHE